MKSQIITKLQEFNYNNGIVFISEKEAEQYYKDLVELIENIIQNLK